MYTCYIGVTISSIRSPLYLRSTTMSVLIDGTLINATCYVVFSSIGTFVSVFFFFLFFFSRVSHFFVYALCVYVCARACVYACELFSLSLSLSLSLYSTCSYTCRLKGVRNRLQKGWYMKRGLLICTECSFSKRNELQFYQFCPILQFDQRSNFIRQRHHTVGFVRSTDTPR